MEHLPLLGRGLPQLKTLPEDFADTDLASAQPRFRIS